MVRNKRVSITVNQGGDDKRDYKRLIKELSRSDHAGNVYSGRSESDIVKMLLDEILPNEHRRVVGTTDRDE
jgi:hypothetical protein